MRGLGFFPSDYEIECLHHELAICGKRKVTFEDLVKLFTNHSHSAMNGSQKASFENSLRNVLYLPSEEPASEILVSKSQLLPILAASEGEKLEEKDAETYLKEIFGKSNEISLDKLTQQVSRLSSCFA